MFVSLHATFQNVFMHYVFWQLAFVKVLHIFTSMLRTILHSEKLIKMSWIFKLCSALDSRHIFRSLIDWLWSTANWTLNMHCTAERRHQSLTYVMTYVMWPWLGGRMSRDTCDMTLTSSSRRDVIMTSSDFRLHLLLAVLLLPLTARRKSTSVHINPFIRGWSCRRLGILTYPTATWPKQQKYAGIARPEYSHRVISTRGKTN